MIDPLAFLVLRQIRGHQPDTELPAWFEAYTAALIAIALLLLYFLGFFARSRLRRGVDWVLLRVPIISIVYKGMRKVFAGNAPPDREVNGPSRLAGRDDSMSVAA